MNCIVCRKGPSDGVSLYRVNAKGQPGIWACKRHIKQTDAPPVDSEVQEIVGLLEGFQP